MKEFKTMDALINVCMDLELQQISKRKPRTKKNTPKQPREPRLNQKYKQSINPSKRHRDRLNGELDNLAKLLPFPEDVIARLDKLSILRLSVSYLRNKNFFKGSPQKSKDSKHENISDRDSRFSFLFNEALDGFILVVTLDGEVFFVSEGVKEYLGYSQSQVLHQPLETLVHDDDRDELSSYLNGDAQAKIEEVTNDVHMEDPDDCNNHQREFVIRLKSVLNTSSSDMYKPFKVSGTIRKLHIDPDIDNLKYALFAFCTPARTSYTMLEIRMKSTLFCSKNRIDLSFLDLDARGKEFFGYSKKEIFGRSSYVLVHRQDLQHLRCKHTEIMTCGKSSFGTFRLMSKNNDWAWVCGYARVLYKNGKPDFLVTTNRIMSEEEGHAMLKIRDDADYKALANLGLIEPDDPAKALELGFPNRTTSVMKAIDVIADRQPIPMPLGAFLGINDSLDLDPSDNSKSDPTDLLKDTLFDVDAPERFLNSSVDRIFNASNYPLANLSPEDFQADKSCPSPTGSNISERTTNTHVSMLSNTSSGCEQPNMMKIKPETGCCKQELSPCYLTPIQQPKQQHCSKPILAELTPVGASSSSSLSHSPQQINAQAFTSSDSSLFDVLSNLDNYIQQQQHHNHQQQQQQQQNMHSSRAQLPFKYSFMPTPPQMYTSANDGYCSSQQRMSNQSITANIDNTRTQYGIQNNRLSLYEQIGPNVTVGTPEYDLASVLQAQMDLTGPRSQMDTQRHINFTPFMDVAASSQSPSWLRSPPNLTLQQPTAFHSNPSNNISTMSNSLLSSQQFLQGTPPYNNWM